MPDRRTIALAGALAVAVIGALYAQRPFRQYPSMEGYDAIELPPDYKDHTEWVQGRLMYPQHPNARFSRYRFYGGGLPDWREGGTSWTQDYPRADRHFASALRRLTRIDVRIAEQPVNPDDQEDFYNWPWLIAGEMGDWKLTDAQAKTLREFLLRGGFIMMDDFWNPDEYERFDESMRKVFPDRPVVDIDSTDSIFHSVYDLDDRYQVPGRWAIGGRGPMSRRAEGTVPRWLGVYDDKQRLMVAICFNNDVGDSWEWADEPIYPERYSALGIRIGVNYVVYAMTH